MSTEQKQSNYSSSLTTKEDASTVRQAAATVTTAPIERSRSSIGDVPAKQQRSTATGTLMKLPYHVSMNIIPYIMTLIWPCMLALPLSLTIQNSPFHYSKIFPFQWYDTTTVSSSASFQPKPLGLLLGISSVGVGQVFVWIFFFFYKYGYLSSSSTATNTSINGNDNNAATATSKSKTSNRTSNHNDSRNDSTQEPTSIQTKGSPQYEYIEGLRTHVSQPEGFAILIAYLGITWMYRLIPMSYYQFTTTTKTSEGNNNYGGIQYKELFFCLVVQDGIQYIMHRLEHDASPKFYQYSHKPHHKFLNPRLFDAFNGSLLDTICMIIVPLFMTANIVRTCNVWTYMAFGSIYASWLTIIHSEYTFIWDPIFRMIGFGTPADHHVHHAFFKYNYGHLFMWFDQFFGTYQNPHVYVPKHFNEGV